MRRGQRPSQELLRELHWLPVASRINFKVALLCYKAYKLHEPAYLQTLIQPRMPTCYSLRSDDYDSLVELRPHLVTAARRFSMAAPKVWNSLSQATRQTKTVDAFKSALKTELMSAIV